MEISRTLKFSKKNYMTCVETSYEDTERGMF